MPPYPNTSLNAVSAPIITIDGPTASGKGTLAQAVAAHLHFHYLDSGALYRVLALDAVQTRRDFSEQSPHFAANLAALAARARFLPVAFMQGKTLLEGQDVSDAIRAETVGNMASHIAVYPAVRAALLDLQRSFARPPGLVTDGRDMGTVIFPQARLKIFLTASTSARAERRFKQLIQKGFSAKLENLLQDLQARDARDANRATAPLVAAQDAVLLDNSALSVEQTVEKVVALYQACCKKML